MTSAENSEQASITKHKRPSWDEYFLEILHSVAKRASCDRGRCACVIQRQNTILATGYVGAVSGSPSCDEIGHDLRKMYAEDGSFTEHCVRTLHSEQNALLQALKNGTPVTGATMYVSMLCCRQCAMSAVNAGIVRVVCEKMYKSDDAIAIFKQANIELVILSDEIAQY